MDKRWNNAAVEINCIMDYLSYEMAEQIPLEFKERMKELASTTYKFKYDVNKSLEEQTLLPDTSALIAYIYRNYICDDNEALEYDKVYNSYLKEMEEQKLGIESLEKNWIKENVETSNTMVVKQEKQTIFKRIIMRIKKLLKI